MDYIRYRYENYTNHITTSNYTLKEGDRLYFQNTDILVKETDAYLKAKFTNVKRVKKVEEANVIYGYALNIKYAFEYEDVIYENPKDIPVITNNKSKYLTARRQALRTDGVKEVTVMSSKTQHLYDAVTANLASYTLVKDGNELQAAIDAYSLSLLVKPPDGLGEKLQFMILNNSFLMAKTFLSGKNVSDYETELIECFYMLGYYSTEERKWIKEQFKYNKKIHKELDCRSPTSSYWTLNDFCNIKKRHPSINLLKVITAHLTV